MNGYPLPFAVGLTGASSTIGPIIPPSLPMVIFGVMANTSIGQLFAAGLIPGPVMVPVLMLAVGVDPVHFGVIMVLCLPMMIHR
ncbi:tripartite ATP-independent transporter DctM subunit [Humitalea rosea]|uniref:Tripartite ATP-independent transporter DctM subunit n=1 Tax=Humitalea rosea TaxID=990373 RepID=A0A2W7IU33_9PROT|nr:TRAP transporter large permease subunit [Humitalea rosea]PZW42183.1 tripartite ATP-independent transporter DctM subunit [Humitalea rosea]